MPDLAEDATYTGKRAVTTIELNAKVLEHFRKAVSNKHSGKLHGFMYIEYNNALNLWTMVMNGDATFTITTKGTGRAPVFGPKDKESGGGR